MQFFLISQVTWACPGLQAEGVQRDSQQEFPAAGSHQGCGAAGRSSGYLLCEALPANLFPRGEPKLPHLPHRSHTDFMRSPPTRSLYAVVCISVSLSDREPPKGSMSSA